MRTSTKILAMASFCGLAFCLSNVPAVAGDVTFDRDVKTALRSENRSTDSWIVNVALDEGTAVSGIASVQAIQTGDVTFRDRADLEASNDYNGKVIDVAWGHESIAVSGIGSIQALGTSSFHFHP
jgi:hypothetical protein